VCQWKTPHQWAFSSSRYRPLNLMSVLVKKPCWKLPHWSSSSQQHKKQRWQRSVHWMVPLLTAWMTTPRTQASQSASRGSPLHHVPWRVPRLGSQHSHPNTVAVPWSQWTAARASCLLRRRNSSRTMYGRSAHRMVPMLSAWMITLRTQASQCASRGSPFRHLPWRVPRSGSNPLHSHRSTVAAPWSRWTAATANCPRKRRSSSRTMCARW